MSAEQINSQYPTEYEKVEALLPGQSISYTLEFKESNEEGGKNAIYYLLPLALLTIVVYGIIKTTKRKKKGYTKEEIHIDREEFLKKLETFNLNEDEKRALLYILDKGGRASQAEVRTALGIPKTTAWRMFKRLERQGLVKIIKGRKENWVELRP